MLKGELWSSILILIIIIIIINFIFNLMSFCWAITAPWPFQGWYTTWSHFLEGWMDCGMMWPCPPGALVDVARYFLVWVGKHSVNVHQLYPWNQPQVALKKCNVHYVNPGSWKIHPNLGQTLSLLDSVLTIFMHFVSCFPNHPTQIQQVYCTQSKEYDMNNLNAIYLTIQICNSQTLRSVNLPA